MNVEIIAGATAALLVYASAAAAPMYRPLAPDAPVTARTVATSGTWDAGSYRGSCCVVLHAPPEYVHSAPYSADEGSSSSSPAHRQRGGLAMSELPDGTMRLRWVPDERPVKEVALFLADERHTILAEQTLRAVPYDASFRVNSSATHAGARIVYPDGQTAVRVLPFAPR